MAEDVKNLSVPIVAQFSNAGIAPASPEFVSDLSREVGVTLSYLRQTSEGRPVFQVIGLFAGFRLSDVLQRLQRRADVISLFLRCRAPSSLLPTLVPIHECAADLP